LSVDVIAFVAGVVFIGVAILGGGVELRELKIPALNRAGRALFFVAGLASILLSLYLSVYINAAKTAAVFSNPAQTAPAHLALAPAATVPTASAPAVPVQAKPATATDDGANQWLTVHELHELLSAKASEGFYPVTIMGKCDGEAEKFQVEWRERPLGLAFQADSHLTREQFDELSQKYTSDGFSLDFMHSFKDCSGKQRYQAQWVKQK
jgi:hypothetical protein